jgi:ADP-ribose pyrophosphatase YjhB (NUDIX family)
VEKAVKREAKEELTLEVEPIKIFNVLSEPLRSNGDTLTILFIGIVLWAEAKGGDNSEQVQWDKSRTESRRL